jgi:uncharacterized membrane protein YphA (DoxX/SURF4 family)
VQRSSVRDGLRAVATLGLVVGALKTVSTVFFILGVLAMVFALVFVISALISMTAQSATLSPRQASPEVDRKTRVNNSCLLVNNFPYQFG